MSRRVRWPYAALTALLLIHRAGQTRAEPSLHLSLAECVRRALRAELALVEQRVARARGGNVVSEGARMDEGVDATLTCLHPGARAHAAGGGWE